MGSTSRSGRSSGGGNGNPFQDFQDSCLGNPMDRGAWWVTVNRVTKRQLSNQATTTNPITRPLHRKATHIFQPYLWLRALNLIPGFQWKMGPWVVPYQWEIKCTGGHEAWLVGSCWAQVSWWVQDCGKELKASWHNLIFFTSKNAKKSTGLFQLRKVSSTTTAFTNANNRTGLEGLFHV